MGNVPPEQKYLRNSSDKSSSSQQSRQMINQLKREDQKSSPLLNWYNSLKYAKDLADLIYSQTIMLSQWLQQVQSNMKKIKNKQIYQQHCRVLLQYCLCDKIRAIQDQKNLRDLFLFYKNKLQSSYFCDGQFSESLLTYSGIKPIPQKLLYLYNWPNISGQYIQSSMLQLSPQSFLALQQLANLIIQQQIFIQNQLHFEKFILHSKAVQSCFYYPWDVCQKIYKGKQKQIREEQIRKIHQLKKIYISMASRFLKYNNFQNAELIMRSLYDKKYQLNSQQLLFYLKIKFCQMFTYDLNIFQQSFSQVQKQSPIQIFSIFFSRKSFSEVNILKRCYQIFDDQYKTFVRDLKDYAFSQQCSIEITLMSMDFQLKKQDYMAQQFVNKLKNSKCDIYRFQRQILIQIQKIGVDQLKVNLQIVLNCCQVLYSLGINILLKQLTLFKQFQHNNSENNSISLHELRFLAVACLKNIIGKYFVQDKQKQINFNGLNLRVNQPTSILQLCMYFQTQLFGKRIIFKNQIHQIIFQHMLYFYKYEQIKQLLKIQNLQKYQIQRELIELIIRQNIEEILKSAQSHSGSISSSTQENQEYKIGSSFQKKVKDVKIQLNLLQDQEKLQNKMVFALFSILKQLQSYNIYLTKQEKQSININLLYTLLKKYPERVEIIDFDELYKNIRILQTYCDQVSIITNEFLKFKFQLANISFKQNRPKFGQKIIQSVMVYQPPWVSSQLIKILQKNQNLNQIMINLAFQHCIKGQDLAFLLRLWKNNVKKSKANLKEGGIGMNLNLNLNFLQSSSQKFVITNGECIQKQCQQLYHNLVSQMMFNYEILSQKSYKLFFVLLGTEPDRAFFHLYKQGLDIGIIQIFLKEAIKSHIVKFMFTLNNLYKVIYLMINQSPHQNTKIKFSQFKSLNVSLILKQQKHNFQTANLVLNSLVTKYNKILSCLYLFQQPQAFLKMYLQTPNSSQNPLYLFLYEENYRKRFFTNLIQQPMGTNHIKIFYSASLGLNIDILNDSLRILCDKLNTNSYIQDYDQEQAQIFEHIVLKLMIWSSDERKVAQEIVSNLVVNIFSVQTLITMLQTIKSRQSYPNQQIYHSIITEKHLQILRSLSNLEVNTQFYGLIPKQFFKKKVEFNNKEMLQKKHLNEADKKILRRQLKDRNVLVLSKCLFFFYGMNLTIQREVLSLFLELSPNCSLKQTIQGKLKLMAKI